MGIHGGGVLSVMYLKMAGFYLNDAIGSMKKTSYPDKSLFSR